MFYKKCITGEVSGVTPTNNAIKDVIKAIKFLKIEEFYWKKETKKITSQKWRFLSFLRPLMSVGLLLIKMEEHH